MEYVKNGRQGDYIKCATRPCRPYQSTDKGVCKQVAEATDIAQSFRSNIAVYSVEAKAPTLTTMGGGHREPKILVEDLKYRKLTPKECMRLQTVPENHIDTLLSAGISNTQLYKMTGNAWTMEVIKHIFKAMIKDNKQ